MKKELANLLKKKADIFPPQIVLAS